MRNAYASFAMLPFLLCTTALSAAPMQADGESHRLPAAGTRVLADEFEEPGGYVDLSFQNAGVRASYEAEGQRISFETRRGPRTPRALRSNDPGTPLFEIDVRLVDERGVPFFVQFGGHGPGDDSWNSTYEDAAIAFLPEPTEQEVRGRFETAVRALRKLREVKFNRALTPEHQALINILPLLQAMLVAERIEEATFLPAPASSCSLRQKISIYQSPYGAFGAYHSGTLGQTISKTGTPITAWLACNHGRCPGASGMKLKCSWTSLANRCALGGWPQTCFSPYFTGCNAHVCNDDTMLQYSSVRYNTTSPHIGTCFDCPVRIVPPNCF